MRLSTTLPVVTVIAIAILAPVTANPFLNAVQGNLTFLIFRGRIYKKNQRIGMKKVIDTPLTAFES